MCQPCVKILLSLTESTRSCKSRSDEATMGLRASSPVQYRIRDVLEPVFQLTWAWVGAVPEAQPVYKQASYTTLQLTCTRLPPTKSGLADFLYYA